MVVLYVTYLTISGRRSKTFGCGCFDTLNGDKTTVAASMSSVDNSIGCDDVFSSGVCWWKRLHATKHRKQCVSIMYLFLFTFKIIDLWLEFEKKKKKNPSLWKVTQSKLIVVCICSCCCCSKPFRIVTKRLWIFYVNIIWIMPLECPQIKIRSMRM